MHILDLNEKQTGLTQGWQADSWHRRSQKKHCWLTATGLDMQKQTNHTHTAIAKMHVESSE